MGWESVLKGGREYQDFSKFFRDLNGVMRQIVRSKSSKQFQQEILQPIANMRSSMYEAAINDTRDYYEIKGKLKNYLKQKVAPLNRNYAEALQRIV